MNYSVKIAEAVNKYLTNSGLHFSFNEETGRFNFILNQRNKLKSIYYSVIIRNDTVQVYADSPVGVSKGDAKTMTAMAEYICRVNYGLRNACFELDFDDGDIRCKSVLFCGDTIPTEEEISCCFAPVHLMDVYGNGILDVMYGAADPAEAVKKCEDEAYGSPSDGTEETPSEESSSPSEKPPAEDKSDGASQSGSAKKTTLFDKKGDAC